MNAEPEFSEYPKRLSSITRPESIAQTPVIPVESGVKIELGKNPTACVLVFLFCKSGTCAHRPYRNRSSQGPMNAEEPIYFPNIPSDSQVLAAPEAMGHSKRLVSDSSGIRCQILNSVKTHNSRCSGFALFVNLAHALIGPTQKRIELRPHERGRPDLFSESPNDSQALPAPRQWVPTWPDLVDDSDASGPAARSGTNWYSR